MAGIFGYISKTSHFNVIDIIHKLRFKAEEKCDLKSGYLSFDNNRVCLGWASPNQNAIYRSADKNYTLQLFGEVYLPDGNLLSETNFENGFLKPFLEIESKFLVKLNGAFLLSLYNKSANTIKLINDPFGNFSLYYLHHTDIFIFSSQIHGIVEAIQEKSWDNEGLKQLIGFGYTLNGDTYYKNVKRLQAGETLTFSRQKISIKKYDSIYYCSENFSKSNIQQIQDTFISSIASRINNYSLPGAAITGGFDSRVTWAIIKKLNSVDKVTAFTHGIKKSRDLEIAAKISKRFNFKHHITFFNEQYIKELPSQWELYVRLTEGFSSITGAHALEYWQNVSKKSNILLDSHGGVLFRRQFMKAAARRISHKLSFEKQLFKYVKSSILELGVLKPDIAKSVENSSIASLKKYFGKIPNYKDAGNKIDSFYFEQVNVNRYSTSNNAQMNWILLAHPFLSAAAFDALQKIPVAYRSNQSIYRFIIKNTTPSMRYFQLENMGMPAPYFGFTYFRYIPMIYEMLLNKSNNILKMEALKNLSMRKFVTDYDAFFRLNFRQIKEILLRPNNMFFDLIDKRSLESALMHAESNHLFTLSKLDNLITLKLFFDIFQK
jgi:hypothetical protein